MGAARHRGLTQAAAALVAARCEAPSFRGWPGGGQAPVQGHPVRSESGSTEGAGAVTTFKTAESPFKVDNTASNMCGFTLMNNQVGEVVAQVMATKPNV